MAIDSRLGWALGSDELKGKLLVSREHFVDKDMTAIVPEEFPHADGSFVTACTQQALMRERRGGGDSLETDVEEVEHAFEAPHEAGFDALGGRGRVTVTVERSLAAADAGA